MKAMQIPWMVRSFLLVSAAAAGGVVFFAASVAGWPAGIRLVVPAIVTGLSLMWQCEHFKLLAMGMDTGAANPKEQRQRLAERAAMVTWSAVAGGIFGYVLGCVLLLEDLPLAQALARHEAFGDAVAPQVDSSWSAPGDPWWMRYPPEKPGLLGALRYVVAGVGAFTVGKGVRWMFVPPAGQRPGPRGRTLLSYGEAKAVSRKRLPRGDPGLYWGGVRLPSDAATSHLCAVGTTGSGKTISLRLLMQDTLPSIGRAPHRRALVYDPKRDTLSCLRGMGLGCQVHLLNAFDRRSSAWDMAVDCDSPTVAMQIASILIPEEEGANRFFPDAARHLLAGVLTAFIKTCPRRWGLRDVVLAMQHAKVIRAFIERLPETRHLLQYFDEPRTFSNILSTLATKMAPFEPLAGAWTHAAEKISLRDWVRGESILVLGNDERIRFAMDAINRVIFQRLSELLLAEADSDVRRTWMFLDEVREAGKLSGLSSLLTKGRSRGVSVVLGFQDIEGLREVYGERVANELVGQCSNKALLRIESPETARWAASVLGEVERYEYHTSHTRTSQGKSSTVAEQLVKRETVLPAELMNLPPTTRANGLTGYFVSPYVGAYRATIPGEELARQLSPREKSVPDFLPIPTSHEYLQPWTAEDCRRLLLDPTLVGLGGGTHRPAAPRPSGPRIVLPQPKRGYPR